MILLQKSIQPIDDIGVLVIAEVLGIDAKKITSSIESGIVTSISDGITTLKFYRDNNGKILTFETFQPGVQRERRVSYENGVPASIDGMPIYCNLDANMSLDAF